MPVERVSLVKVRGNGNDHGGADSLPRENTMKKIPKLNGLALLVVIAGVFSTGLAATAAQQDDEIAQGREMMREGRLDIVRSEIHLTEEESAAFWPLYGKYRDETDAIQDRYAAMITEYVRRYDNADLSNEYADELLDTFLAVKYEKLDVQKKYLPEFRAILPALKVARLYQLENKLNAEIDAQLALVVPLVDPS
ncbi:MAG: hypothetical protein EX272_12690 [Chromatiales bacterium]|nr:MAG: hypothetical protein EX272_12690 [Chromatiales bacterium]